MLEGQVTDKLQEIETKINALTDAVEKIAYTLFWCPNISQADMYRLIIQLRTAIPKPNKELP